MNPVSPVPAIASLVVAVATSYVLTKKFGEPPKQGRFVSIDGLRGYLAFFVFLHHSCIWYFYLKTGRWEVPPSKLYTHLGQTSVALFFMITGFLFYSKIIDGRTKGLDWSRLFISRFLRLVPLYFFAMFLVFSVVANLSKGILNEPIPNLIKNMIRWLGFTILGAPNINGIEPSIIIAKVTWTLPYEWCFYLLLPVLALTARVIPPMPYILLGIGSVIGLATWHLYFFNFLPFIGGIAASILLRSFTFRKFAESRLSAVLIIVSIVVTVTIFPSIYSNIPFLLLSLAFSLIAGGNSIFGILHSTVSRTLGEISYSIYLLHGIVLFIFFNFCVGIDAYQLLSPMTHWLLVVALTPMLVSICFLTFRFIERPAMRRTSLCAAKLRSLLPNKK